MDLSTLSAITLLDSQWVRWCRFHTCAKSRIFELGLFITGKLDAVEMKKLVSQSFYILFSEGGKIWKKNNNETVNNLVSLCEKVRMQ